MDRPRRASRCDEQVLADVLDADFVRFPFRHQLVEFERHAEDPARALLWQMRTGKSKACIDAACHNAKKGLLDTVLVVAPNGVHRNWVDRELPAHHWRSVPYAAVSWSTDVMGRLSEDRHPGCGAAWRDLSEVLRFNGLTWLALASETVTRDDVRYLVASALRRRSSIMLIVDECDDYGKPGSKKTHMLRAVAKRCRMRRILSGTAVENSPLRSFSQYEILRPGALGFTRYADFEAHHAEYRMEKTKAGRSYPKLVGYRNLDELKERMAEWSSVVLRSDCEDLPELVHSERHIELTAEQRRVYSELHTKFTLEVDGENVDVGENTSRLTKLQQVVSGFVRDRDGRDHWLPGGNPRLDATVDEVERCAGKVIVWCAFRPDMDLVASTLRSRGHEVMELHGRTSDSDKDAARAAFAPGSERRKLTLVGHPKTGGRGFDLSDAEKIVHHSHVFDAIVRGQSDERATAMGGRNIPVVDVMAPGVDSYVRDTVSQKRSVAEDVARSGLRAVLERVRLEG